MMTTPEPKSICVQHVVHLVGVLLRGARLFFQRRFVSKASLLGGQSVSWSSTILVSIPLTFACQPPQGRLLRIPTWHPPFVESFCRKHASRHCTHCHLFLALCLGSQHRSSIQNPSMSVLRGRLVSSCGGLLSNPCLHVLSYHGASRGVTSSHVPSLSTFSSKMPVHKLRC